MGRVICVHAHSRAARGPVRSRRAGAAVSQVVRAVVFGGFSPAPLSPPQLGLSHAQQPTGRTAAAPSGCALAASHEPALHTYPHMHTLLLHISVTVRIYLT